jgi:hypothetical protein
MTIQPTPNLTAAYSTEFERQIKQTVAGMAHLAASGPLGAQCKDCAFYGYNRVSGDGKLQILCAEQITAAPGLRRARTSQARRR